MLKQEIKKADKGIIMGKKEWGWQENNFRH